MAVDVVAPMPGTIAEILVSVGDEVQADEELIILEAMKMENNIESDKEGRVVSIKKQKGDAVLEGDILIVIGE